MKELPRHLSLEVTARCNHACPFCYGVWHERPELAGEELSTEAWGEILEECARRGVEDVQFTGGEPLLRADLEELVDRARAAGLKTSVYTNASLLDEARLEGFKRRRTRISTSLPGLASYGEMTGTGRGPWGVLEAVARAAELGWPMGVGITIARPKLAEAAEGRQVLVITHLPAVAAMGRVQFAVEKGESGGRTRTAVRRLEEGEREGEIARMLGGRDLATAVAHARELLGRRGGKGADGKRKRTQTARR